MNILSRIKKLEIRAHNETDIYCLCNEITLENLEKKLSPELLEKDFCETCEQKINEKRIAEIIDYQIKGEERIKEAAKAYNQRQV